MKKIMIITSLIMMIFAGSLAAETSYRHGGHFYRELQNYGRWIEMDNGLVVWQPNVYNDWIPYSDGEWVWTNNGWYWDSYEPFGYIVYHYGRWYNDEYYGWIWVPDDQWGPAWVEWRYDDDYIGWAPLPPYAIFSVNVGIHFSHNYYNPYRHWHFVSYNHFCTPGMHNYYVGPKVREQIYGRTKYRNDYNYRNGNIFNRGVDPDDIRKRGHNDIRTRDIQRVTNPEDIQRNRGDRNTIRTYIASNNDISRNDLKDVSFTRGDRRSSLDITKINRNQETVTNPRVERNQNPRIEERKIDNRNEVRIEKQTPPVIERRDEVRQQPKIIREQNNEVRKQNNNNRNQQRNEISREQVQQRNDQRNEQRVEKRTEQRVEKNNGQRNERNNDQRVIQRTEQRNDNRGRGNENNNSNGNGNGRNTERENRRR